MDTKILLRPLNFHLRYQHWESTQKEFDLCQLHECYTDHVLEHQNNNIQYENNHLYSKLQWHADFKDLEQLAYILEHF
jgi:hypothetical protein